MRIAHWEPGSHVIHKAPRRRIVQIFFQRPPRGLKFNPHLPPSVYPPLTQLLDRDGVWNYPKSIEYRLLKNTRAVVSLSDSSGHLLPHDILRCDSDRSSKMTNTTRHQPKYLPPKRIAIQNNSHAVLSFRLTGSGCSQVPTWLGSLSLCSVSTCTGHQSQGRLAIQLLQLVPAYHSARASRGKHNEMPLILRGKRWNPP